VRLATGGAIFLGAFLLFLVQPLTARRLLPAYGGSPTVWIVSLLFFQCVLLAGYVYAHALARLSRRRQSVLHVALLLASLAFVPFGPEAPAHPSSGEPAAGILWLLGSSLGLPLLLVSSTNPRIQSWLAARERDRVYRLFAVSNLGSLLGLWSYPFLVEPFTSVATQVWLWTGGFGLFVLLDAVTTFRAPSSPAPGSGSSGTAAGDRLLWLGLAATGSILLLATSNQLTRNVAAVPFLWVLPLSLYLLSFIIAFERDRWYVRSVWAGLFLASFGGVVGLLSLDDEPALWLQLAVYSVNLLSGSMICHGEISRRRPGPGGLTSFYLHVALGGALGGGFVALLAPKLFSGYWEYPLGLALVWTVGGASIAASSSTLLQSAWGAGVLLGALSVAGYVRSETQGTLFMKRSFFGVVRVYESNADNYFWRRTLWNGPISHGAQLLRPERRREPILYYGPETGVGIALQHETERPRRIGVIGFGTGSLAAYTGEGDSLRFYELNPDVVEAANDYFFYLEDTAADVEVQIGDGRLALARELREEGSRRFDVLVLDAFAGDAIPMHLLTREAFALYHAHLAPDGVLAVHVSNLHFNLRPVVRSHAEWLSSIALLVESDEDEEKNLYVSDWVLVTRNASFVASPALQSHVTPFLADTGYRPEDYAWTDDYANFFRALR
jgi:hypothetical protein